MSEQELEKEIKTYQEIAKVEPGVDVSMLMMNALKKENESISEGKSYKWAYTISLGLPPFGLLFAIKYLLSGDSQDRTAAYVCILLTIVSIVLTLVFGKLIFSGSGASVDKIQQIKLQDIQQLSQ